MLALAILVACTGAPGPTSSGGAPPGAPSIVWISLDTLRADHLSLYGGRAATPALDRFAQGAVVFEHAYSQFPQTQQSHWAMFTSTLPEVHRYAADAMGSPYGGATIASHLKAQGYATGAFVGGVTLTRQASHLDRGFDTYDDAYDYGLDRDLRPAPEVRAAALKWMGAQAGPYFAFVHFFEAHAPYAPKDPKRYDPDYTGTADGSLESIRREWQSPWMTPRDVEHVVALYDAEVTELDEELGPLLDAIPADAIVVISSDHGESFEHGYLFNHPEAVYDSVLHVPLVIRAPKLAARRVSEQVGLLDVAPTVLALAGLPALPGAMGVAVLPETPAHVLYARSRAPNGGKALLAARTPAAKAVFEEGGERWGYDLGADPGETTRVAVPADLADAEARYTALVAPLLAKWPPVLPTNAPPDGLREKLEAIGYTTRDPGGPPPRPSGPGPQGPPPGPSGSVPPPPGVQGPLSPR